MAAEMINQKQLPVPIHQNDPARKDVCGRLTSDVDALLAIFDSIEQSVAAESVARKLAMRRQKRQKPTPPKGG
jgi:hypothetical protein